MEKFVEFLVLSLAKNKDEVKITSKEQNDETTICVSLSEQDFAHVVGKHGKNAHAIRTLVSAFAKKQDAKQKYNIRFE